MQKAHQLFKDFLQAKFREALSPEQQADAYFQAGCLLEKRGDLESAVDYYLQAGATDRAVDAIERVGLSLLKQAKTTELTRWLQNLPPALVQDHPWLLFFHYVTGRLTGAPEYFASLLRAHSLFQQNQDLRGLLLTSAHLLDVSMKIPHPAVQLATLLVQAEELLQREDFRAFPYEGGFLCYYLGLATFIGLDVRKGNQLCRTGYLLAKEAGDRHLEIQALIYSHLLLSCLGELHAAEEISRQAEGLLADWNSPELQTLQLISSCHRKIFQGELEEGAALVQRAWKQAEEHGLTFMYPVIMLYRCMSLGYLGKFAEATRVGLDLMELMAPMKGFFGGIAAMHLAIFSDHQGDLPAAQTFAAQARQIFTRKEHPCEYHLRVLQIVEAIISYHLEEFHPAYEQKLQETLREATEISSPVLMLEAHWALALWQWRQGRLQEAAAHIKAGMEVADQRGSHYSVILSPRDRSRIFTLALELGVEEVWDRLPPLLAPLADLVGPDLTRLSRHKNLKIAARAGEIRRALHRQGVPRLQIQTLGGFRLRWEPEGPGEPVWEGNQPKLLLKALVARGCVQVPQDVLLEDLWPEGSPDITEKNFRVSLHRLRKALEPRLDKTFGSSYLQVTNGLLSLDQEMCRVDVDEFLSLYASGDKQEELGNYDQALALYKKAVALYGGDFLPEELYLPWAERRREELRGTHLELLERVSRLFEKQGTLGRAIEYCKKAIQADPMLESTYRRLMTLYARRGMRTEALRTYEACRKALKKELDTEPDEVTTAIFRKIQESD